MGADRVVAQSGLAQLGAQGFDVGVDGAVVGLAVRAPGAVQQLLAAQRATLCRLQGLQQRQFVERMPLSQTQNW